MELFQLLIDTGDVDSADAGERNAGIKHIKRWMEIAVELGARGVRYVPGDGEPTPETIRSSGEAFRELFDFATNLGLKPATENYRHFNMRAGDLLGVLEHSERDYGVIADFGNARGPNKYETLEAIMPRANINSRLGRGRRKRRPHQRGFPALPEHSARQGLRRTYHAAIRLPG